MKKAMPQRLKLNKPRIEQPIEQTGRGETAIA
jgi:hypothetical protein